MARCTTESTEEAYSGPVPLGARSGQGTPRRVLPPSARHDSRPHPAPEPGPPEEGRPVDRGKYEQIRAAIRRVLEQQQELTFTELTRRAPHALDAPFDGATTWYTTAVELDMEARGEIQRLPSTRPQRIRLA